MLLNLKGHHNEMKKARIKKELKEWGIFAAVLLTLYFTGLHTEVAAFAQRMVLATGVANPKIERVVDGAEQIQYNFSLTDINGKEVAFSSLQNKVIFVNLWATWCAPCIAEMPGISSLYERYRTNEEIAIIMINVESEKDKVRKFIDKKGYEFPVYFTNQSGLPKSFQSNSIPTTLVIDKTGMITYKKAGMANYDADSFKDYLYKLSSQ
jgi:thiol-disulfide isomerase/thioredoxin